jgi:hypothetical protein
MRKDLLSSPVAGHWTGHRSIARAPVSFCRLGREGRVAGRRAAIRYDPAMDGRAADRQRIPVALPMRTPGVDVSIAGSLAGRTGAAGR